MYFACESVIWAGLTGDIFSLLHLASEGNGNPLQYSCLENPMDGGAWSATGYRSMRPQGRKESEMTERLHFTFT